MLTFFFFQFTFFSSSSSFQACVAAMAQYADREETRQYVSAEMLPKMHKVTLECKDQEQLEKLSRNLREKDVEHSLWVCRPCMNGCFSLHTTYTNGISHQCQLRCSRLSSQRTFQHVLRRDPIADLLCQSFSKSSNASVDAASDDVVWGCCKDG